MLPADVSADPPGVEAAAVLGADAGRDRRGLDEETAQWLAALGGTGRKRDEAIASSHEFLLRIARAALPPCGAASGHWSGTG
jgi:hypothetical protein